MTTIRGIGVDHDGMSDRRQQRRVVHAVGVGVALGEIDAVLVGPVANRFELAGRPDERPGERAVVGVAVALDAVPGRHDVVEPQPIGERLDEVVRRRRRQHDRTTGLAMRLEHRLGERLHQSHQLIGDAVGGCRARPHGDRPLAKVTAWRASAIDGNVSPTVLNRLKRNFSPGIVRDHQTGRPHRLGEHLPARAHAAGCGRDRRTPHPADSPTLTSRPGFPPRQPTPSPEAAPENGKRPDGGSGRLNLEIPSVGDRFVGSPSERNMGGVLASFCL